MSLGGLYTKTFPIPCGRCKGIEFHICKDGDDYACFCANNECLKSDADASKSRMREEKAREKPKTSGAQFYRLGQAYWNATLADWIAANEQHAKVNKWFTNKEPFLIVLGHPGTGKSYMCAAVLNYLYDQGYDIVYTTHRRFIDEIKKAIQSDKREHEVILKYAQRRFLIFDDLGSSRGTAWEQEMILDLIDRRYGDNQKTLITSNLNQNELREFYGKRVESRLFDQHNAFLNFWSNDRRQNPEFRRENG